MRHVRPKTILRSFKHINFAHVLIQGKPESLTDFKNYDAPATDINSSGVTSGRDLLKAKTAKKIQDQEINGCRERRLLASHDLWTVELKKLRRDL